MSVVSFSAWRAYFDGYFAHNNADESASFLLLRAAGAGGSY